MQIHASRTITILLFGCLTAGSLALAGCAAEEPGQRVVGAPPLEAGSAADPLIDGDSFVAIERAVAPGTVDIRRQALRAAGAWDAVLGRSPQDFYLAVHKRELGKQWFLSAYLDQIYTAGFTGGGYDLGTRVVSFEVQNDRLYMFDVDARRRKSDLFDPDVIIEAYPVVRDFAPFEHLRRSRDYILIDPAAGLNRFSLVSDMFGTAPGATRFFVEISFLQGFRRIADGITYQHIFTGFADGSLAGAGSTTTEPNAFRASGTMGIALRRYGEGEGYTKVALPPSEHYFRSEPRVVPNEGRLEQVAIHWNIHEGMEPIEWVISPALAALDQDPLYAGYELVESVRRGVESWNQVFGFPVFTARLAAANEPLAVDDKNFILFDPDPTVGYAFAQFRTNPNTGEIRGASVYFGASFLDPSVFEASAAGSNAARLPAQRPAVPGLAWGNLRGNPQCAMWAPEYHARLAGMADGSTAYTRKESFERSIAQVIAHEIGHTLGLRHNFKGSLVPPSSSVMDYLGPEAIELSMPGSYDIEAIRYLYGLDSRLPSGPFCTDEHMAIDPACMTFDAGSDPLAESATPDYDFILPILLARGMAGYEMYFDYYSRGLRSFAQGGTADDAWRAWELLVAPVRVPLAPELLEGNPGYGAFADAVTRRLLTLLYVAPGAYDMITSAPSDPAVVAGIVAELRGNLLDLDGVRSFATRRLCVDILRQMQSLPALQVLLDARAALAAALDDGSMGADERALTRDLWARIDRAVSPYYE